MKILGASSLYWTIRKQTNPTTKSQLERNCIAIPGLSVNPYARNKKKTIQHLLENTTAKYEDVAIWHDTVNNSLSKHHSNYNRPLSPKQLIRQLENYPQIKWVVFCPRVGAPNVFQQLCSSQLPTFSVLQYTFPDIKKVSPKVVEKYYELHQPACQELKTWQLFQQKLRSQKVVVSAKLRKRANRKRRLQLVKKLVKRSLQS